jgi:hypothetical protein
LVVIMSSLRFVVLISAAMLGLPPRPAEAQLQCVAPVLVRIAGQIVRKCYQWAPAAGRLLENRVRKPIGGLEIGRILSDRAGMNWKQPAVRVRPVSPQQGSPYFRRGW